MDKFVNFISYLKRQERDDFYIDLSEIEEIIKCPLSDSAYKYSAYWYNDKKSVHHFPKLIAECGYKVSPDLKNKRIRLYKDKTNNGSSKDKKTPKLKKKRTDIPDPSEEIVDYYLERWETLEDYKAQEDAIDEIFLGKYNSNNDFQNILIKASILNDFYSTNIFKIYPVAKHIYDLDIDERLKKGDESLVNEIASVVIGGKEKYFYSFATKYCSHHYPLQFPIYDSYVDKVLMYYKGVDGFYEFKEEDLKNYPKFKEILIKFREFYKLGKYNLKELDKYLWQFGKQYFPKNY